MGVAGKRERHARGHIDKNIGLVRQQNDGVVGGDARQRPGQVVLAQESAVAKRMRDLVAEAGKPEAPARFAQQHGVVFHQRDAYFGQRGTHAIDVVPPVVIAEDGINAERRLEAGKLGRPGRVRHPLGDETMGGEKVAQHHDKIGVESLRGIDHLRNARDAHVGSARMQVGNDGDAEAVALGPGGRRRPVAGNDQIVRGFGGGIDGRRRRHQTADRGQPDAGLEQAAAGQRARRLPHGVTRCHESHDRRASQQM